MGINRRAAEVLPLSTRMVPRLPAVGNEISCHCILCNSSGRKPVSMSTEKTSRKNGEQVARYAASSFSVVTRSRLTGEQLNLGRNLDNAPIGSKAKDAAQHT